MTSSTISSTRASAWPSWIRVFRRNPLFTIGVVIAVVWIVIAIFAPKLATADPLKQNVPARLTAPNEQYPFGTDELGRDIFTRVLYGGQITIPAGLAVVIIGSALGVVVGALAGFFGGLIDELLMRTSELFMAFPTIILALAITAALGANIRNAIISLVVVWWPSYARLIRSLVLEIKNKEYVEGTRSVGAGQWYILTQTILPNCISSAIVLATLDVGSAILTFAGLSFLGLGPEPATPEWGRMVSTGIDFFDQWWLWLYPGLAIAILVMAFNFIGDGLRDYLDPRLRKG